MSEETSAVGPEQDPDVLPEYAGSADGGVRDSVPEHDPMAGDVVAVVQAEHAKLDDLFGVMVALADEGDLEALGRRWYGVVREALEFQAAVGRVVLPAVAGRLDAQERDTLAEAHAALVERLQAYDELNPDVSPDDVRRTCLAAVRTLRGQQERVVPALRELDAAERDRLGEDLRQVMG